MIRVYTNKSCRRKINAHFFKEKKDKYSFGLADICILYPEKCIFPAQLVGIFVADQTPENPAIAVVVVSEHGTKAMAQKKEKAFDGWWMDG